MAKLPPHFRCPECSSPLTNFILSISLSWSFPLFPWDTKDNSQSLRFNPRPEVISWNHADWRDFYIPLTLGQSWMHIYISQGEPRILQTQRKIGWEIDKHHSSLDQKISHFSLVCLSLGKCLYLDALRELGHIWKQIYTKKKIFIILQSEFFLHRQILIILSVLGSKIAFTKITLCLCIFKNISHIINCSVPNASLMLVTFTHKTPIFKIQLASKLSCHWLYSHI